MKKPTIYDKITAKYQKDLISALSKFVSINSVYDENTVSDKNPYGAGVTSALDFIASLARKDGFKVTNYDNRVVEIICGEGDKNITIMAHADVVPAGTGWDQNPFEVVEKKGVLCGRGVADDKGPLLATYYALKALKANNMLGKYKVRFLVGGDEERGSSCMEHYFQVLKKEQPTLGFSPDSDFPLIFAEKGIINFETSVNDIDVPGLISIEGGVASNSVIERCDVKFELDIKFLDFIMNNYHCEEASIVTNDDITTVTFHGKAAHGAMPELGVNAGLMAITALAKYSKDRSLTKLSKLYTPLDGSGYNCAGESGEMGHNSSNVGLISYKEGKLSLVTNFRYVDTCDKKDLINQFTKANDGFEIKILGESPLLFYPRDSLLISTLMKSYQDETDDLESKPLAIGGGTYAKEADNVVAFGMQFPGWESNMHSPGESTKKEDLFKSMAIYARAIVDLGKAIENEDKI